MGLWAYFWGEGLSVRLPWQQNLAAINFLNVFYVKIIIKPSFLQVIDQTEMIEACLQAFMISK